MLECLPGRLVVINPAEIVRALKLTCGPFIEAHLDEGMHLENGSGIDGGDGALDRLGRHLGERREREDEERLNRRELHDESGWHRVDEQSGHDHGGTGIN